MEKASATRQTTAKKSGPASLGLAPAPQFTANPMLRLQQSIGNQAMLQLFRDGRLRAKLRVNSLRDSYELEAERVADAIGSGAKASPLLSANLGVQHRESPSAIQSSTSESKSPIEHVLNSAGRPLETGVRRQMQDRFGQDFSHVRVHTDEEAALSAKSLNALAYTLGSHVVFDREQYNPSSTGGQKLLAHELAHVVQQSRGRGGTPTRDGSGPLEAAADLAAATFSNKRDRVAVHGSSTPGIACQPDDRPSLFSRGLSLVKAVTPTRVVEAVQHKYEEVKQDVAVVVDQAKEKYETTKQAVIDKVSQLNTAENRHKALEVAKRVANPSVLLADATAAARKATEARAAQAKNDPRAAGAANALNRLVTRLDKTTQVLAKLNFQPTEKLAEETAKHGFLAGIKAWQKSEDENLENLTKEFKQSINDYEDGQFEPPPQTLVDPKAHPTLSKIETSLLSADQAVGKVERQVGGGVAKALWSMGTGIANIFVHPVRTVRGLGELPSIPGTPNPVVPLGKAVGLVDDLITSDKPAKQVLAEFGKEQITFDPKREFGKSEKLVKALGENYIAAVHEGRFGEIPGLLAVDVGSLLIPGGASTKVGEVAKVAGTIGEVTKAVGTVGEVGKAVGTVGEVGKAVGTVGEVGKAAGTVGEVGKAAGTVGEVGKGLEATKAVSEAPEISKGLEEASEAQRAAQKVPVEAEPRKPLEKAEAQKGGAEVKQQPPETPKDVAVEKEAAEKVPEAEPQKPEPGTKTPEVPEAPGPTKAERAQLRKDIKSLKGKKARAEARMNQQSNLAKAEAGRAEELRRRAVVETDPAKRANMYKEAAKAEQESRRALEQARAAEQKTIDSQLELQRKQLQLNTDLRSTLPCFAAGTSVWTPGSPCAIEDLRVGEVVLAYDFQNSVVVPRRVLEVHRNKTTRFYSIQVNGTCILATSLHRFWVVSELKWVEVRALRLGMQLMTRSGQTATVAGISISESPGVATFNLQIDQFPNYFVGAGVLVHNAGAPSYEFGNLSIYEGVNPKFPDKIYIGQTDDLIARQGEHQAEALKNLEKPGLTPEQREFWEFKKDMVLKRRVSGLNADQANYMEQKNMDLESKIRGDNNVMNRREQVSRKNLPELEARIKADPNVKKAGLCP